MTDSQNTPTILIVDDTRFNRRLLARLLQREGYLIEQAENGVAALEIVQSTPLDLILLDVSMPKMDGFEVCQRLKADPKTNEIPVIFITALDSTEDKGKGFEVGGVDYIVKPIQETDVLARVRTHLQIRSLQKNLRNQIAELDAFAHTVAHDIKNPLAVLVGYVELLQMDNEGITTAERAKYLNEMLAQGKKLFRIIEELLLLSSVRQDEEIETHSLEMGNLVGGAMKRVKNLIEQENATLQQPQSWPTAIGYAPWVEEIWVNYLSNALKYGGEPPEVSFGATELPAENAIKFWVQDNGAGLTEEEQSLLFTPFERLDQIKVKEGHGLGLSIVRRIITRLGGKVGVDSEVGQGSSFWFTLPVAPE